MQRERYSGMQKMLWLTMTAVFLSVLFLSLFQTPVGKSMSGDTSGCPFMSHEEVLCSMSVLDHVSAWKSTFTAIAPSFTLLLFALVIVGIAFAIAPNLLLKHRYRQKILPRELRDRIYTFSYRSLQDLFSNGILHPKLF